MNWLEALILGLVQGLTEFLPVSSSGHIEIGKAILSIDIEENLAFTVLLHSATVLSTIVVFRKDLLEILKGLLEFKKNEASDFSFKILLSMVPAVIVGLLWEDSIEELFSGKILFVGLMLLITASLLTLTYYAKRNKKDISYGKAFIIGLAQAVAILPGISRSGATIATGLYLGVDREKITRFSFLMVLLPIIGASSLSLMKSGFSIQSDIGLLPMVSGFLAAFFAGWFACKLMIRIVKKGKLIYFAAYCLAAGLISIIFGLI